MKRILTILFVLTMAVATHAQPAKLASVKQNVEADNLFLKALQTGDVNLLDGIIAPEFYNHTGNRHGLDSLKLSIAGFHSRMKPTKMTLIRQLVDNDCVADWVRYDFSDPNMKIEGIEMTQYRNGKAVEHWFFPAPKQ